MLQPKEMAAHCAEVGHKKSCLSTKNTLVLAILSGFFIAFGAIGYNAAIATIPSPSVARLVGACVFPAGLSMVLICGSELFTGNNMTLPMAYFYKRTSLKALLRNWSLVYIGNAIGSLLIAAMVHKSHILSLYDHRLAVTTMRVAIGKLNHGFTEAIVLGILCNILVCLGVWASLAGTNPTEKIAALFFPIMVFVLAGFEHSIANMYFIPAALFAKGQGDFLHAATDAQLAMSHLNWWHFLIDNLLPVTIGNIIGGLVVALFYAMVYPPAQDDHR